MADSDTVIHYDKISVCVYSSFKNRDREDLLDVFYDVSHIDLPDDYMNRIVDIDEKSPEDSTIYIGESGDEDPTSSDNNIVIEFADLEDEDIHTHFYADSDTLDSMVQIFDSIQSILGRGRLHLLTIESYSFIDFSQLNLPIDYNHEFSVSGVRYKNQSRNFSIAKAPENVIPEDKEGMVYLSVQNESKKSISEDTNFIDEELSTLRQHLREISES